MIFDAFDAEPLLQWRDIVQRATKYANIGVSTVKQ